MLCATYSRYPHPVETQPMLKTHTCGELRTEHIGQTITLAGWVNRRRDQGGLIFIDLRDRWGITQVAVDQATAPQAHATASEARGEYVLQVQGVVPAPAGGHGQPQPAHRHDRGRGQRHRDSEHGQDPALLHLRRRKGR